MAALQSRHLSLPVNTSHGEVNQIIYNTCCSPLNAQITTAVLVRYDNFFLTLFFLFQFFIFRLFYYFHLFFYFFQYLFFFTFLFFLINFYLFIYHFFCFQQFKQWATIHAIKTINTNILKWCSVKDLIFLWATRKVSGWNLQYFSKTFKIWTANVFWNCYLNVSETAEGTELRSILYCIYLHSLYL